MTVRLPPSRFPDRDMTPEETARSEQLLRACIRREQQAARQFLRYWMDETWRENRVAETRRRNRVRRGGLRGWPGDRDG